MMATIKLLLLYSKANPDEEEGGMAVAGRRGAEFLRLW